MKKRINILGTTYTLRKVNAGEDEYMDKMQFGGYCDGGAKEIVILNMRTLPDFANESPEVTARREKETLRHEVIHAFFNECGLKWNAISIDKPWVKNEEMIDWIAIQFPKILKVFIELDCVGEQI